MHKSGIRMDVPVPSIGKKPLVVCLSAIALLSLFAH